MVSAYFEKALSGAKPCIGAIIGMLNYILFPEEAFATAAFAVCGAMLLDIITKYVALSRKNGGFTAAVRAHKISSENFWKGTQIKLYAYLVIAILAGLSYRVVQVEQVGVMFASVVYSMLFLREAQSILENLCDAGADMKWCLVWTKKKQREIIDQEDEPEDKSKSI